MATILADNVLNKAAFISKQLTTHFYEGGEATGFEFINCFNNNASSGFKKSSAVLPKVAVSLGTATSFSTLGLPSAIGFHGYTGSNASIAVYYSTASTRPSSSATGWTQITFYTAPSGVQVNNLLMQGGVTTNTKLFKISNSITGIKHFLFVFNQFDTGDVLPHIQIGHSQDVDIEAPFIPPLIASRSVSIKTNAKGNPMISDVEPTPTKLRLKVVEQLEADMHLTIDATGSPLDELWKGHPFIFSASYDTYTYQQQHPAYYCIMNKVISAPRYKTPTTLQWTINCLGYN